MSDEPSKSGISLHSSTGWFAVHDETGESVGNVVFVSSFRAAEWASAKFKKSWPELKDLGFRVRGGAYRSPE